MLTGCEDDLQGDLELGSQSSKAFDHAESKMGAAEGPQHREKTAALTPGHSLPATTTLDVVQGPGCFSRSMLFRGVLCCLVFCRRHVSHGSSGHGSNSRGSNGHGDCTGLSGPMGWLGSVPRHAALLHRDRVPSACLNPVQRNARPLQTTTAPSDKGLVPPPARISACVETAVAATSCRYPAKARMMQGTCPQVKSRKERLLAESMPPQQLLCLWGWSVSHQGLTRIQ